MNQIIGYFSSAKYHGLKNQGATCYLNSVLQVLFMTKEFREDVERYNGGDTECIEHHLKDLFKALKECTPSTYAITKKLGINNVNEQRDAAEYLEKILSLTDLESKASKIFHGDLIHENKCSECHRVTNTGGPFWHLPLALDSCSEAYSVVDGIENFFSTSEVSGLDQMYCDRCDDKANAALTSVMTRHPDVLILLLKRFEFDYRYMAYIKINCCVNVPFTLQIPKNDTFRYELYAVVDHFGDLRGGHYTASIKPDEDNRWYKFDDGRVSELSLQLFQVNSITLSQSAYLLFYKKKKMDTADTCTQVTGGKSTPEDPQVDIRDSDEQRRKAEEPEDGEEAEAGNVTAEVSTDRHEETETRDIDIDRPPKKTWGEEDTGGKTGVDEQGERRESLSREGINDVKQEASQEDSVKVGQNIPQDVSDVSARHGDLNRDEDRKKRKPSKTRVDTNDRAYEDSVRTINGDQELKRKQERFRVNNEGVSDRQNAPKQEISDATRKDVGADKQGKEQGKSRHTKHIPKREDSPGQAGSTGRLPESQIAGSDEKSRHSNAQPNSKICDEKITEEENRPDSGMKSSSGMKPETKKDSNFLVSRFSQVRKHFAKPFNKNKRKRRLGDLEDRNNKDIRIDKSATKLKKKKNKDVDGKKIKKAGRAHLFCLGANPGSE